MSALRAVLFDWDGTLVDSAEPSFRSYARVFPEFGIPFTRADFERTYSPDWYHTYRELGLPREHWDAANARWLEHYARERPQPLPGAVEAVERLRKKGYKARRFEEGYPEWKNAGLPIAAGLAPGEVNAGRKSGAARK